MKNRKHCVHGYRMPTSKIRGGSVPKRGKNCFREEQSKCQNPQHGPTELEFAGYRRTRRHNIRSLKWLGSSKKQQITTRAMPIFGIEDQTQHLPHFVPGDACPLKPCPGKLEKETDIRFKNSKFLICSECSSIHLEARPVDNTCTVQ
eukprot:g36350.t1